MPHMKRCLAVLSAGFVMTVLPAAGWGEVRAQLSQTRIEQGQAVQLKLEASGSALAVPDLSPLQTDFQIANRNLRQQSSTINGRRTQRIGLNLTLIPLRSGELQIPAIRFGNEASQPLRLQVDARAGDQSPPSSSAGGPAPAWEPPRRTYGNSPPIRSGTQPPVPAFAPPMTTKEPGTQSGHPPAPEPEEPGSGGGSLPLWGALGLGLLVFLALLRRGRRFLGSGLPEQSALPPAPPAPLSPTLSAVRDAYSSGDPDAARNAWLAWAGEHWPDDAPTNLTRLAVRLDGSAREAVLKLDQALYSPDPVNWNELTPWEDLR